MKVTTFILNILASIGLAVLLNLTNIPIIITYLVSIAFLIILVRLSYVKEKKSHKTNNVHKTSIENLADECNTKDIKIAKLENELEEYKSINIGIDIGQMDNTAVVIMQVYNDEIYQLYGRTFKSDSEVSIILKEIVEDKKNHNFSKIDIPFTEEIHQCKSCGSDDMRETPKFWICNQCNSRIRKID